MKFLVVLLMGMGWVQGEWVELFDGKSTKGWTPRARVEPGDGIVVFFFNDPGIFLLESAA